MRRFLGLASTAVLLAVPVLALSAAQALGNHVQCGTVITQDTTLDSDVLECPERAITIGGDNVTLDLNGHTIAGSFSGSYWGVGVFNNGHSGVTIENGVIRGLGVGVRLDTVRNNRLRKLSISGSGSWGITMSDSNGNLIAQNSLTDNGGNSSSPSTGGMALGGAHNEITENLLSGNFQYGISLSGDDNTVDRNTVSGGAYPIYLGGAAGSRVQRNSVSGSGFSIFVSGARENQIERNRLSDNSFGIQVEYSDDNQILGNAVRDSGSFGVHVVASNRNLVKKNAVSSDTADDGIGVSGQDNRIVDNRVWVKRGLGIGLYTYDRRSLVAGNLVSAPGGTGGIYLGGPAESTRITRERRFRKL